MGQEGYLTFFSTRLHPDPGALVISMIRDIIGAERTWIVSRTRTEVQSWRRWQRMVKSNFTIDEDINPAEDPIGENLSPGQAAAAFKPGTRLMVMFIGTPLAVKLDAALSLIEKDVRGDFVPGAPFLQVGWHDVWEGAEHDEGYLFGRAFVSLGIMGHSSPRDWQEYRRRVFGIPEVVELQEQIEQILGPVESCIFWNV